VQLRRGGQRSDARRAVSRAGLGVDISTARSRYSRGQAYASLVMLTEAIERLAPSSATSCA
jgi:hypothetical protein